MFSAKLVFGADQVPMNSIGGSRVTDQGLAQLGLFESFNIHRRKKIIFFLDIGGPRPRVSRDAVLRASFWRQPDPGLGAVTRELSRPCHQWRRKQLLGLSWKCQSEGQWGLEGTVRNTALVKEWSTDTHTALGPGTRQGKPRRWEPSFFTQMSFTV